MFIRAFVAIPINYNEELLHKVRQLRKNLDHENFRWVAPSNWHITLHFFGKIQLEDVHMLGSVLKEQLTRFNQKGLNFNRIKYFLRSTNPVVLYAGLEDESWMRLIHHQVAAVLEEKMSIKNSGRFSPHLTLARMKKEENMQIFTDVLKRSENISSGSILADEVVLYESKLTSEGPVYDKIVRIPFVS